MASEELTLKQEIKLRKCDFIPPIRNYVADIWRKENKAKVRRTFDTSIGNRLFLCNLILANLLLWYDFLFVYEQSHYLVPLAAFLVIGVEFLLHILKMMLLIGKMQKNRETAFTEQALDIWWNNTYLNGFCAWLNNILLITVSLLSLPLFLFLVVFMGMLTLYYFAAQIKEAVNVAICVIVVRITHAEFAKSAEPT